MSGSLAQEADPMTSSSALVDRATQWAQSAVDYQMVAYLLIRKSNIACLAGDATTAVDLASAAQEARAFHDALVASAAAGTPC